MWGVAGGDLLHVLGQHDGCGCVLAFSEDYRHLLVGTKSGELLEHRERGIQADKMTGFGNVGILVRNWWGWSKAGHKTKDSDLVYRLPLGYKVYISLVMTDRAIFLCMDGRT